MDGIRMADGTIINPETGRPLRGQRMVEVPSAVDAVNTVTRVRRRVADLPDVPQNMSAIAIVGMYHLYGLSERDIAVASGLSNNQVANIMRTDAFTELLGAAKENLKADESDMVREIVESGAVDAARGMVSMMDADDDKVAIVAMKDVLDRAGHRPADVVEHKHKMEGGLTIEYVTRNKGEDAMPTISVDYKEIEDGDSS